MKRWSETDDANLRQHYGDTSNKALAQLFGCSESVIHYRAHKLNLRKSIHYMSSVEGRIKRGYNGPRIAQFTRMDVVMELL